MSPARTWSALILLAAVIALLQLWPEDRAAGDGFAGCYQADLNDDLVVDLADITTFLAPVRRLDTNPATPFEARWDLSPGAGDLAYIINIQDLISVFPLGRTCPPTEVQFLSKLTDLDDQYNADPAGTTAMMNANYEAVMTFDCGICRTFGAASTDPVYVYQDPTKILTNCEGEQPGTDCSDILLTTGGARCWQQFFNGSRYLADITQADVRDEIVAKNLALAAESAFDAIYIDVAEAWLPNAEECPGTPAVSNGAWLAAWATLAERLQTEIPGSLLLNSQFFTWHSLVNLNATDADRFWSAADVVEIEFGWAYGRHGEGTASGAADKLAYVDRLHGLGTAIFDQDYPEPGGNYDFPTSRRDFGLAMYFIEWEPGDLYGTFNQDGHGSAFWPGYNTNIGAPMGPRQSCGSGCYTREFEQGTVTANVITKTGVLP